MKLSEFPHCHHFSHRITIGFIAGQHTFKGIYIHVGIYNAVNLTDMVNIRNIFILRFAGYRCCKDCQD